MSDPLYPNKNKNKNKSKGKSHVLESAAPDPVENDGVAFLIAPGQNIADAAAKIAAVWGEKFKKPCSGKISEES